jgi:hypothetical protein
MVKNLLTLAFLSSMAIGANAYDVDDFIYTRSAKYKVTAANLVTNGELKGASLDGWTATDATSAGLSDIFTVLEGGGVSVNAGMNSMENGMYQLVKINEGGKYVVTMKVRGADPGYTDIDLFAGGNNYIFAYFNTDGALATKGGKDDVELSYGEGGAAIANCYSFTNEDYTEFAFPVDAASDGNIVIDLRGLTVGIEIKDIECHKVQEAFDERKAESRLAWIKSVLGSFEWSSNYEGYDDLMESIKNLENAISSKDDANAATMLENLESSFYDVFAPANLSNVLNTIDHPDGAGGNYSANWMNWTYKYNKCINEALSQPWVFNCDRWAHKTAAAETPLQIQWMRGYAYSAWDPQARLTTTLDKGTYRLGITGSGGMMTMNKNRWVRSGAYDNVNIEMILENAEDPTRNDTIVKGTLSPSFDKDFIGSFTLEEDKEVTILLHCYQVECPSDLPGNDVALINPVLYKVLVKGEMTPEEKSYIANVETQIAALEDRIKVAEDLVASTQTAQPWGKDNLQKGIDEAKKRLAVWKALDQDALLALCAEGEAKYEATAAPFYVENEYVSKDSVYTEEVLANIIVNAGVRYLNREFIDVFNAVNTPLTDMPDAIATAEQTLATAMYTSGDKETFAAVIKNAKDLYAAQMAGQYTADGSQALVDAKAALAAAIDEFIASVKMENLVDIDFSNAYTETPAAEEGEDPTYSIEGAKGKIDILGAFSKDMQTQWTQYAFGQGFNDLYTDVLYFGKGDASVAFDYAAKSNDVIAVSFDIYYGYLSKQSMGFYLLNENGDTISGYKRTWDIASEYNTLGVDESKFSCVGGKNNGNVQGNICTDNNKTHFEIYLNYTDKNIFVATTYKGEKFVNEAVPMSEGDNALKKIIFSSTYTNGERCCWLDNVKVSVINDVPAAGTTGINEVAAVAKDSKAVKAIENGQLVIKTAKGTFNAVGAQIK